MAKQSKSRHSRRPNFMNVRDLAESLNARWVVVEMRMIVFKTPISSVFFLSE